MLENIFNFIGNNLIFFMHIQFFLFIALVLLNFKNLKRFFSGIKKKYWILLFLIILFSVIISFNYINTIKVPVEELTIAKEMLFGGDHFLKNARYGPTYPYFLYLLFSLKISLTMVSVLNVASFVLTIIGLFLLSYFITKNEKFSLLSAIIYVIILHCIFILYPGETMFIEQVHFFITYFILFSLYAYKVNNRRGYALVFLLLLLMGNLRFEYEIFIYIFFLGLIIFNLNKFNPKNFINLFRNISPGFLIFLLLIPSYLVMYDYSIYRWADPPHQLSSPTKLVTQAIFWWGDRYFSSEILFRSLNGFFHVLFMKPFVYIAILTLLGAYWMYRESKSKHLLFLMITFLLPLLPYLFCWTCFQPRYVFYLIIPLVFLSANGIYYSIQWMNRHTKNFKLLLLEVAILILWIAIIYVNFDWNKIFPSITSLEIGTKEEHEIAGKINDLTSVKENRSVLIITSAYTTKGCESFYLIRFLTLKDAIALQDLIGSTNEYRENIKNHEIITAGSGAFFYNTTQIVKIEEERESIYNKTLFDIKNEILNGKDIKTIIKIPDESKIFFVEYPGCDYLIHSTLPCELLKENLNLLLIHEVNGYKLYELEK